MKTGRRTHYGVNPDGSLSVCRAKPDNVGRYGCHHVSHVDLTDEEYRDRAERAASMVSTGQALNHSASPSSPQDATVLGSTGHSEGIGPHTLTDADLRRRVDHLSSPEEIMDVLNGRRVIHGASRERILQEITRLSDSRLFAVATDRRPRGIFLQRYRGVDHDPCANTSHRTGRPHRAFLMSLPGTRMRSSGQRSLIARRRARTRSRASSMTGACGWR